MLHNSTSISVSLISFPVKTFSVLFSLCARLNGQLACQFSSANRASHHIISFTPTPHKQSLWGVIKRGKRACHMALADIEQ